MNNIFYNYFNRPEEYKTGQIWHCSEIDEDIVVTDTNDYYLMQGIVRGMILSRATHLDDEKDVKFIPKGDLRKLYGLERILLRITDGPILTEDLSFFKGEIPKNISSRISVILKQKLNLNPIQEELSAKYLEKLKPLREKVMLKSEQYESEMNKLRVFVILKMLKKNSERIRYRVAAADESNKTKFDVFWKKERAGRENSIELLNDNKCILRLIVINKRLYLTAKSKYYKKISEVKITQNKAVIIAVDKEISFGKEKRLFTSFEDKPELKPGECVLRLKIDGKDYKFNFTLK